MNVRYFLKQRLAFIRQLYANSCESYVNRKRMIEAGEDPYSQSHFEDDGEPPYLDEWLEADESIQVLGRSCVSMLSSVLHLYFTTWERLIGIPARESMKSEFKNGWVIGYMAYFRRHAKTPFEDCPVDLSLFEELALARNRIQHPESIATETSSYSKSDLQKLAHPFFVDERDREMLLEIGAEERAWLQEPPIRITHEKLEAVLESVERFAEWLETVECEGPSSWN